VLVISFVFGLTGSIIALAAVPPVDLLTASLGGPQAILSWVTPSGTFSEFDIRRSLQPISEDNFNAAPQLAGVPSPIPGETQTMDITGLASSTTYYFGIRSINACGNASPLATISGTTNPIIPSPPIINGGTTGGGGGWYYDPNGLVSIIINNGATSTADRAVALAIHADNATEIAISDDATSSSAIMWRLYTTTSSWMLSSGNGQKSVYVRFRNGANEFSNIASSSILFTSEQIIPTVIALPEPVLAPVITSPKPVLAPIVAKTKISTPITNGKILFLLLPDTVTATEGDHITIIIAAKPVGSGTKVLGGFRFAYPQNLITLETITYGQGWVSSSDPSANIIDPEHGLLIQTTQHPQNLESSQVFAVLTFSMKQAGSGFAELTNDLVGAPTSTTAFSIIALEKDLRPELFANLIFSLSGSDQNITASGIMFVFFGILFIISFILIEFLRRKYLKNKEARLHPVTIPL